MTAFRFSKLARQGRAPARQRRAQRIAQRAPSSLDKGQLQIIGIFALFGLLAIVVCFFHLVPLGTQELLNQIVRYRKIADVSFAYESSILTEEKRALRRKQTPPVFELDEAPYQAFAAYSNQLLKALNAFEATTKGLDEAERLLALKALEREFKSEATYAISAKDLEAFLNYWDSKARQRAFLEGLQILKSLYQQGIYRRVHSHPPTLNEEKEKLLYSIQDEEGLVQTTQVLSLEQASKKLRMEIATWNKDAEGISALFRFLNKGIDSNLSYNEEKTLALQNEAALEVKPVIVEIALGQTLIEPGEKITDFKFEQLNALHQERRSRLSFSFNDRLLVERILMTGALFLSLYLLLKALYGNLRPIKRKLILAGIVILVNLMLIRSIIELAGSPILGEQVLLVLPLLPYLATTFLATMVLSLLQGIRSGLIAGFIVCLFNAMMQGEFFPIFLSTLLANIVAAYFFRDIKARGMGVKAAALSGTTLALTALLHGVYQQLDWHVIGEQMASSLLVTTATGVIVLGSLPILETLFRATTSISLLELTDNNRPLLQRMQLEAPGSYHHSLMVAHLAEQAATKIHANGLLCRVGGLYHDIGKLVKPEYFAENQTLGENPLLNQSSSMSALVIKSHVKEGVQIAKQHKLPQLIIDIIQQHHGTSLIQYFYYQALKHQQQKLSPNLFDHKFKVEADPVNETTYRYEGPKPQFKESAILLLADSVEAASRCLKKVSAASVESLVEKICSNRIEDGQLSESPLTFAELNKIKKSFVFSLLNTLHNRVEYPEEQT